MDFKTIYDLLKEMRGEQSKHSTALQEQSVEQAKQGVCLHNLEDDMGEVKKDLSKNTADVAKHIRRSDALELLQQNNAKKINNLEECSKIKSTRIAKLEEPMKAKAWLKGELKWILSTAVLAMVLVSKIAGLW